MKLLCLILSLTLVAVGCSKSSSSNGGAAAPASESTKQQNVATQGSDASADLKLKTMTKVKIGVAQIVTQDFLPWYLAMEKGIFSKYNLEVSIESVEGGVVALRGLQSGTFDLSAGLAEPVLTAVSKGADMKIIGTLSNQTLFKVFVSPDIQKVEDLKGKAAAVLQPGNGTDVQMRWWLKQNGLQPDKDVRIISAGGNPARLATMKSGQVQVTVFGPPTYIEAEKAGLKPFAILRDELKSYNFDTIFTTGKVIREKPEVLKTFMAATAEAIQYTKDPKNLDEVVQIGVKSMKFDADVTKESLQFVIPSIPDKAKLNLEGIKFAIDASKEVGILDGEVTVDKVVDESFYAK